jgi:acetate kinase
MFVLVLNSGSSTLKYQLVDPARPETRRRGTVERIGEPDGVPDHHAALGQVFAELTLGSGSGSGSGDVGAVGHRVVHGGSRFIGPVRIDDQVLDAIRELIPLAPLHNPGSVAGIEAARARLPELAQVAVFDTAFHHTVAAAAATYAIDRAIAARLGIRRYGFHGTSHRYVAEQTARLLDRPLETLNLIVLHLGSGASAAAIAGGRSVDTSMGFTPLEGLVMGTRAGDLDPGVLVHLQRSLGLGPDQTDELLEHHSGLSGLCGDSDMRAVLARRAAGDRDAQLAFDVYCHRIRSYVGAYHAVLGRVDAIVFTAGVGENAAEVRAASLDGLAMWGITIDPRRNATGTGARILSPAGAAVAVCVVPTDEELAIARQTVELLDHPLIQDG